MSKKTLADRLNNPLEKEIEKQVVAYAKKLGMMVFKFTSPQRASVPDRLFINPDGLHFYIEFKRAGGALTPAQAREHHRLADQGCHVYVCDNVQAGFRLVDLICNSDRFLAEIQAASEEFAAHLSRTSNPTSH